MAFLDMKFYSESLKRCVSVYVILPEKTKTMIGMDGVATESYKTLWLLHGLSDDHSIWLRRTSIERYAAERGIAVVMPCVDRSWYTDTAYGAKYFTFVTEELPRICRNYFRGMSAAREDNLIAGLSMGGYGAVKAALTYPERYAGCASLSGAMNIAYFSSNRDKEEWRSIFGYELEDAASLAGTKHDVFYLAEQATSFPRIFIWCGTEDALISHNRDFRQKLTELGVEHEYRESEGNHSWKWWDEHIVSALDYLLK